MFMSCRLSFHAFVSTQFYGFVLLPSLPLPLPSIVAQLTTQTGSMHALLHRFITHNSFWFWCCFCRCIFVCCCYTTTHNFTSHEKWTKQPFLKMLLNVGNYFISVFFLCAVKIENDINENYANGDINMQTYTMAMCHNSRCPHNL